MKLVVLGAPGAGKGTQAKRLANHFSITHISTGDMLRDQMKQQTDIGKSIATVMDSGHLVPDELVIGIVSPEIVLGLKNKNERKGFILDGFPRNIYQAEVLDTMCRENNTGIDYVISVEVADALIVERMSGRVVCTDPSCGGMFHKTNNPPKEVGVCDNCGSALAQREDDKAETVLRRLALYHSLTEPVKAFYRNKGNFIEVDGARNIDDITKFLVSEIR